MSRRRSLGLALRAPAVGLIGLVAMRAPAQDATAPTVTGRTLAIVPTLSLLETYTDNRFLTASDRQSSLISQVSPGVQVTARTGRVQGTLDYSLNAYAYSHGSGQNNLQNMLNGLLHAEVVDNRAFIDASATIAQQSISAFGTQSPDSSLQNANQSEVGTYTVSPWLRGNVAGVADYEARASYEVVHSDGFSQGNSRTNEASFKLQSDPSASSRLGWGATVSHQGIAYDATRSTVSDRGAVNLDLAASPELHFTASAGRESSNLVSVERESSTTWGVGFNWRPSERTRVSLSRDKRIYGQSHAGVVEYRTPRTIWRYADTQDVTTSAGTGIGSTQTAYDILFAQYASLYPDPVLRAQLVNATLASLGIGRGALVGGGFLSAAPTVQRRQEFSVALNGLRLTTILTAFQTRTSQLDPLTRTTDDVSVQGTVVQRGLGASASHRLTPESTINAYVSLLKSSASGSSLSSEQRIATLTWTTRIGPHANVSLSGRRSVFSSTTQPYHESALIAGLGFQF